MKKELKNNCPRNGAYILMDSLVQNGIEHIFGYPGGAILPIYDELYFWEKNNLIKHILVRHEQGAVHAADAYARATNKPGVCFATSGPGATNLVTGIANAKMDSIPLIVITGQVGRTFIGTDAFQETDIFGITLPIVKHSYTLRKTDLLSDIMSEAIFVAQNGRPGPVLIDIPKDVGLEETDQYGYLTWKELFAKTNYRTEHSTKRKTIKRFLDTLSRSIQPLVYAGGGIIRSNAFKTIQQLTRLFQLPITNTLMGKTCFNEDDHLSLGMLGMHGTAYANFAVSECDYLLTVGARFDDRVTGKLNEFASNADIIHFDIDAAEIGKNCSPSIAVIGDLNFTLRECLKQCKLNPNYVEYHVIDNELKENWLRRVDKWKEAFPLLLTNYTKPILSPQETISYMAKKNPNAFYTTDVGQHQMWAAQLVNCQPKKWISSSGLGTMGFGLPAAIGAKVAHPEQDVVCISGDSSFQMSIQELGTIAQYQLNIKMLIINNGWQGMVRQWQESFYDNRFSNSYMRNGMPEFSEVSKAYGLLGYKANSLQDLENCTTETKYNKKGVLIDVNVIDNENCYPMVSPGKSNDQMIGIKKTIDLVDINN